MDPHSPKSSSERPEALYALSADPWTLGHSSVLEQAQERHRGRVLVGIANDPKKNYAFPQWARLRLAQKSLGIPPRDVRLVPGSLAKYMMREDVPVLVRGVRNVLDEAAETTLKFYYLNENPELEIDIMHADPDSRYAEISSSGVKESLKVGHDISNFVTSAVKQALESRIINQYPVCVTGEMGAGKSTLSRAIADKAREWGINCTYVDFDSIAHEIYFSLTDPAYVKTRLKIAEEFGAMSESVVTADGFINRAELARIVRENPEYLETLNDILRRPMMLRYGDLIAGKTGIILVDAALLVEFGLTHLGNHHAVVVTAPEETRAERVVERYARGGRDMPKEEVRKMFSLQMATEEKISRLSRTIEENKNGSILQYDNGETAPDAEKAFFEILSKIDVFGELRAQMAFGALGMSDLDASAIVAELKKKHEESHRFYHTWEHIVELLGHLFQAAADGTVKSDEIGLLGAAILFHDAVYDVSRTYYRDNEVRSADYAKSLMSGKTKPVSVETVYSLIRETAHAEIGRARIAPRGVDTERFGFLADLLHDFDMAILGSSPERYALYVNDIIAEFGIYPGREFVKGRIELLEKWIADDDLFRTEYGKRTFLDPARRNMREELARLKMMA